MSKKQTHTATFSLRLRDKHARELIPMSIAVNSVWNYCNDIQKKAVQRFENRPLFGGRRKWPTRFDLNKLTSGSSKLLGINARTIEEVCRYYVQSRNNSLGKRPWLRFRGKKSLGWVPFGAPDIKIIGETVKFRGKIYQTMHWREIPQGAKIKSGSFRTDSRGRWYLNITLELPKDAEKFAPESMIGMDPGLNHIATCSNGDRIENRRHYRNYEDALSMAYRAKKPGLIRKIHTHIRNCRHDDLHKASSKIAKNHNFIVIGDLSPSKLKKTRMAKSVSDAALSTFRHMLHYKAIRHNGRMIEVDERYTTQTCSACRIMPEGRPRGIAGLGIREWTCEGCGVSHDRDVNAARNILRLGLESLVEGAGS